MSLGGIALYCGRAALFAAAVCGIYAVCCIFSGRKLYVWRVLAVAYLAALVQITVIRGGVDWNAVFREPRALPQLVPLKTTRGQAQYGLWQFVYHLVGNLIWFVPLGMILCKQSWKRALLCGTAFSAGIELSQYLLLTGMADVDDVILNAAGTLMGWGMARVWKRARRPKASP